MKKLIQILTILLVAGFLVAMTISQDRNGQALAGGSSGMALDAKSSLKYKTERGTSSTSHILKIPIHGIILQEPAGFATGFLEEGITSAVQVEEQLEAAATNPSIRAIILDIDSPGGTVVAANYISRAIKAYKVKTGKKVYAYVSGMAASGGYWVAAATDKITVAPGALTGSIGVIMGPFKYYKNITEEGGVFGGVVTKDGIENFSFTAGTSKDLLSPYRRMTDSELTHMQTLVTSEYDNFVRQVATARKIQPDQIRSNIKALIYGNAEAKDLKLIDMEQDYVDFLQSLSASSTELDYSLISATKLSSFLDFFSEKFGGKLPKSESTSHKLSSHHKHLPLAIYGDVTELLN